MAQIRALHPDGQWISFDTDDGEILDGTHDTLAAITAITGDTWTPARELDPVTLDHTTGVLIDFALQRAAMFDAAVPMRGWIIQEADDDGNWAPYVPDPDDLLGDPPQDAEYIDEVTTDG